MIYVFPLKFLASMTTKNGKKLTIVCRRVLFSGGELFEKIVEAGSYSEKQASEVIRDITRAIKYMHNEGVVHRDLKVLLRLVWPSIVCRPRCRACCERSPSCVSVRISRTDLVPTSCARCGSPEIRFIYYA